MNWVSDKLRKMAQGENCLINSPMCNHNPETVVLCHGRKGKGMGLKACDSDTVFGCSGCNTFTDQSGAPRDEIDAYWESGKIRMANRMMNIEVSGRRQAERDVAAHWLLLNEVME